jgi:hypothetical protein
MRRLDYVVGLLALCSLCDGAFADDGSFSVRRKPFSVYGEEYEVREHGQQTGTIRRKPFSVYGQEYEVLGQAGQRQGTYRRKPFSITGDEWEFKPGY